MIEEQIVCSGCMSRVPAGRETCPYCGKSFANTNPSGALPVATVLGGHYTVGECLTVDGEGVLYSAVDNSALRRVVIKEYVPVTMCASRAANGGVLPRPGMEVLFKTTRMDFVDLYRSLLRLGPTQGLVQVYDLLEENDTAYAVREEEQGVPFLAYLQRREQPLSIEEAVLLLEPVARGVEALHRTGMLHRGISPETVFIAPDGTAKLSGYATQGLRTANSELRGQLFEGYTAPEQYTVAEFDGKYTDVYALGALFYRAVTGRAPMAANVRRQEDTMLPARSVNEAVPGYVSAALARAMRLAPAERTQMPADLLTDLTTPERGVISLQLTARQKKYILFGAIGIVLVMIVSIVAILNSVRPKTPSSSLPSSSVSVSQSVSSVPSSYIVPNFINKLYTDILGNTEYNQVYLFVTQEDYSNEYDKGVVMAQDIASGTEVEKGKIITLTISLGKKTVLMPEVIGRHKSLAAEMLDALEIAYRFIPVANDGNYPVDSVVRTDTEAGTEIVAGDESKVVLIYIAKDPPAPSSSQAVPDSGVSPPDSSSEYEPGGDGPIAG